MNRKVTLRIKRVFFNAILNKEKDAEYRELKNYYHRLFWPTPTKLVLHYQSKEKISVDITSIEIVENLYKPEDRPTYLKGDYIYKLNLKNPKRI